MPGVLAVMIFAASLFLASFWSVNMPTAVISVLVRTLTSVLVQTFVAVLSSVRVPTSVPAFGYTTASSLALARGLSLPSGNLTMSLDPSAYTSPMVPYNPLLTGGPSTQTRQSKKRSAQDQFVRNCNGSYVFWLGDELG
ncbi:uncharacterized protein H6S33_008297 [Morchella sextelata]|uniref:uncharacterized protein n=1 Tax=Morchella sextelata TaxID=1174677 RepID=UPI001D0453FB|nr:uncharacterized protein H6S33_008297 [Morchella sextelata]KAH0602647.1 hypothetical protein H6S33_008297 [Morchella sextelata]